MSKFETRKFHDFNVQYFHIYNARLKACRDALILSSRDRWGDEVKHISLEQLNASLGTADVFVIGTLFKVMPKQPSILRELEENLSTPSGPDVNFTGDEDSLVLHETDENVKVVGDINPHEHVTGIPVSLLGHQLDGGAKFHVTDICYAGLNLSIYRMPPANSYDDKTKPGRLMIISGLEFGTDCYSDKSKSEKIIKALKKFQSIVRGNSPSDDLNGFTNYNVIRVIIAGNSMGPGLTKTRDNNGSIPQAKLKNAFSCLDRLIYELSQNGAFINVMPGKNDPTSFLLPQQPFHIGLFKLSGLIQNFKPLTNPATIDHGNLNIVGSSGEIVEAIRQHSRIENSTTVLKSTLEWGHLAPSAPDNISCVPFKENDPFILDSVPDIYFAGNQPEYAVTTYCTDKKPKIQIISVPKFIDTLSCVAVNLSDLETELITLGRFDE